MNRIRLLWFLVIWASSLFGQEKNIIDLQYISPSPGSKFVMPGNNIALRHGQSFEKESIHSYLIEVTSKAEKKIDGILKLSTDQKTLIYKPNKPFPLGETIHVELKTGLYTCSDNMVRPFQFQFTVTNKIISQPEGHGSNYYFYDEPVTNKHQFIEKEISSKANDNNLPVGFPDININISNNLPGDEYYFFAPWTYEFSTFPFLIICDVFGTPIYYQKVDASIRDFKVQHNGNLSFAMINEVYKNFVMDSAFAIVDLYQMGNGYSQTDPHDFQLLENGHAFVIGYDWQSVGMDTVVPGGHPNAMVCGFIVQEQDQDKNVIFQWRSWDHFLITDAGSQIDLTSNLVDYVHGNAIEVESDTSILISSRSLDEITKIHRNTGEIIWRFGGKNNQFNVLNDTLGFSMQHDCRRLPNGHITLFDNGRMHPDPKFSSALEYELNEENFEATLVQRLRNNPDIYGDAMGNAQWKNNNSVIVGWGNGSPGITEFSPEGEINLEMEFQGVSYRAFKFPWKSNYLLFDTDTIQYGYIWNQDSLLKELIVYNNADKTIKLSSYYSRGNAFTIENEFPVSILQEDSIILHIKFRPNSIGLFEDMITINSDINSDTLVQRIAQQVYLIGNATEGQNISNTSIQLKAEIFPNPALDILNIRLEQHLELSRISIYNNMGQIVENIQVNSDSEHRIDISGLRNGLYFIRIKTNDNQSGLFKVVKKEY